MSHDIHIKMKLNRTNDLQEKRRRKKRGCIARKSNSGPETGRVIITVPDYPMTITNKLKLFPQKSFSLSMLSISYHIWMLFDSL